jgi:hypothetical protein
MAQAKIATRGDLMACAFFTELPLSLFNL